MEDARFKLLQCICGNRRLHYQPDSAARNVGVHGTTNGSVPKKPEARLKMRRGLGNPGF